jgi:hypothetical protein
MKKYEYVIKSKVNNYMIPPKHIESTPTKIYKNPTMSAEQIIARNQNSKPITIQPITDKEGLHEAYKRPTKLYINGNTMYIAGTNDLQDVYDDLKIPFNQTDKTLRYKNAIKLLDVNPDVTNFVGHSLGGATALELQKNLKDKNYNVNTYGAPVASFTNSGNRYRNKYDPVSILDSGAQTSFNVGLNPHTYDNFDKNKISNNSFSSFVYRTDN